MCANRRSHQGTPNHRLLPRLLLPPAQKIPPFHVLGKPMPLPRRKVQRQIPLHHIKRDDVPDIHRHQVHRKEIHLSPRIALMLRPGDIGCVRSLAAKRRRLHLYPQKPPILFHPNVITGRVSPCGRDTFNPRSAARAIKQSSAHSPRSLQVFFEPMSFLTPTPSHLKCTPK